MTHPVDHLRDLPGDSLDAPDGTTYTMPDGCQLTKQPWPSDTDFPWNVIAIKWEYEPATDGN